MTGASWGLVALLVVTLALQAARPQRRLLLVLTGAGLAGLGTAASGGSVPTLLRDAPWDVLVIVVALGLSTEQLGGSRSDRSSSRATSGARPRRSATFRRSCCSAVAR